MTVLLQFRGRKRWTLPSYREASTSFFFLFPFFFFLHTMAVFTVNKIHNVLNLLYWYCLTRKVFQFPQLHQQCPGVKRLKTGLKEDLWHLQVLSCKNHSKCYFLVPNLIYRLFPIQEAFQSCWIGEIPSLFCVFVVGKSLNIWAAFDEGRGIYGKH